MKQMTQAEIYLLKNELDTQIAFSDALLRELAEILNRCDGDKVQRSDVKRAKEIQEIMEKKTKWINETQKIIANFYKPAMVLA